MQKLENHIENLLREHDFVIIPAFGGFVASEKSAQMENGYLLPPSRTIGFNPDLTYNDGLLVQEIAKAEGLSLIEANNYIAEKVEKLNTTLKTFKHLSFANIGTFHLNGEKVSFEPAQTNNLLKSSFGLQTFYFPEVSSNTISLTEKVKQEEKEIKTTRAFNYAVACVAAILLLLLIPINFNQKQVVYRATFVPIIFPLIAGAGTLTTLLSMRAEYHLENIIVAVILNMLLVFVVLKNLDRIEKILGRGLIYVLRKFFGIILLAIAVKLFASNIMQLFS